MTATLPSDQPRGWIRAVAAAHAAAVDTWATTRRSCWVVLVLGLLLAGCAASSPAPPVAPIAPTLADVTGHRIAAPRGRYLRLAWLPSGWLVGEYEAGEDWTYRLWRLRPDGSQFAPLPLDHDPACRLTRYLHATALPDGRLGYEKQCLDPVTPPGQAKLDDRRHLMAYDLTTGQAERLVAEPLTYGAALYTWNPSMTRGMIHSGSGICDGIAWLTRSGREPATFSIQEGRRHWRMDTYYQRHPADSCHREGRASLPAWSPTGTVIAFFASPQSIGVRGFARLDMPWHLYLMNPEDQQPRPVVADVQAPGGLAWSPDGQQLVAVHDLGEEVPAEESELLLFDLSTLVTKS